MTTTDNNKIVEQPTKYLNEINQSLEYKKILEKHGFEILEILETGGICAYGDFTYTIKNKEINFHLHAWGNWGLTFYDSLGIEVPEDVRDLLRIRYGDRIQDRIPGTIIPSYFYLEGSKNQMDEELKKLLLGIAEYKYILENKELPSKTNYSMLERLKTKFFPKKDIKKLKM